ncbi:hypothetical protein BDR07DRAFT_1495223 [Suillus spraguei]|nr:hypothetical protein BDR07DRAFT_1495223 [Suillus spraguei]
MSIHQLISFIELSSNLKYSIELHQPLKEPSDDTSSPLVLPESIALFLSCATRIPLELIGDCWYALRDIVWTMGADKQRQDCAAEAFRVHGWDLGIMSLTLYPPSKYCTNSDCPKTAALKWAEPRQIIIHTLDQGTLPAWAIHLSCKKCHCHYHYNYVVHSSTQHRTYYPGVPDYLQVAEHQFVDICLAKLWTNQHLLGSCSAMKCACIYMLSLASISQEAFDEIAWPFKPKLSTENVWDAFVLLALLQDYDECTVYLTVPHQGMQKDRFKAAMEEMNEHIVHIGQPEINHICGGCMCVHEVEHSDGEISHDDALGTEAPDVTTADLPDVSVSLGPAVEENIEWYTVKDGQVSYQFEKNPGSVGVLKEGDEALASSGPCDAKSDAGNRKFCAQFGRQRTHNEQTAVHTCGVINLSSFSFLELTKLTASQGLYKDDFLCRQVDARGDEWWADVKMCVDVWHFKNKHKTKHDYCQCYCNPADFPELLNADGTGWWFNTEMLPTKYNFFLDEMIHLHNIFTIQSLKLRALNPRYAPPSC